MNRKNGDQLLNCVEKWINEDTGNRGFEVVVFAELNNRKIVGPYLRSWAYIGTPDGIYYKCIYDEDGWQMTDLDDSDDEYIDDVLPTPTEKVLRDKGIRMRDVNRIYMAVRPLG